MDMSEELEQDKDFGFARVYTVELKYKQVPKLDLEELYRKLELYTGKTDRPEPQEEASALAVWEPGDKDEAENANLLHFFHLNYMVTYIDGAMPAQTSLMRIDHRPASDYETAIQQSWHWPEAGEVLDTCSHSLLLTDMVASGLEPRKRLKLLTGVLRAVLESAPCDVVYFRESDKLVEPGAYLAAVEQGALLYGAMNIRFYRVEGTDSGRFEGLMDSRGLAALGIPDVQCHFYDLEPREVADHLTNIGYYLFDRGYHCRRGDLGLHRGHAVAL
jgi:hypothetical protein